MGFKFRHVLLILAVTLAFVLLAPPQPPQKELSSQDAMGTLVQNAGYGISMPQYDGTRWTMHARVPGCREDVLLVSEWTSGNSVPKHAFVAKIGDVSFGDIRASLESELTANALRDIPEAKKHLAC